MKDGEIYFQALKPNSVYKLSLLDEKQWINTVQAQREDGSSIEMWHHHFTCRDPETILKL